MAGKKSWRCGAKRQVVEADDLRFNSSPIPRRDILAYTLQGCTAANECRSID